MSLKYNDVTIRSDFPGEIDTPTYISDLDATTFPKAKHYQELLDLEKYEEAESYLNSVENEDLRRCMSSAKLLNEVQDRICAAQITINSRDAKQERIMQKEKPAYIDQTTDKYWIKEIGEDAQGDKYGNEYVRYGENLENSEYAQLKIEPGTRKDDTNIGIGSFVTGNNCEASGVCSFAGGDNTVAKGKNQTVVGKYNEKDTDDKYAFVVGGGTSDNDRNNLMTVDWDGNVKYKGSIIANNNVELENGISLSGLDSHIKLFEQTLIDKIYPVGSIYMSVNNVSPSVFLGGTWVEWGAGKVPVGVDTSQTEFATVEKAGGAKTHILSTSQIPSHSHTVGAHSHGLNSHTHSVGKHKHSIPKLHGVAETEGEHYHGIEDSAIRYTQLHTYPDGTAPVFGAVVGSINNKYTTSDGVHSHPVVIDSSETNNNTVFDTGAASGATADSRVFSTEPTGSSGAHNNLQPYITCYMWKRTA